MKVSSHGKVIGRLRGIEWLSATFPSTFKVPVPPRAVDAWGTDQTYPHYAVGWAWAWD